MLKKILLLAAGAPAFRRGTIKLIVKAIEKQGITIIKTFDAPKE